MFRALVVVGVVFATCLAFWPSLDAGWVTWDDDANFLNNPHFRGLGLEQLRWMWGGFHLGIWIPLSWMTLGANYLLFGMEPAGYHATNMLLHALNAVLLYLLGVRVLPLSAGGVRERVIADEPWVLPLAAACGALVFALHPLRVESVTWITERRDVLSGSFYLTTVLSFLRFAQGGTRARRWYVASFASFVLALLAKGTAVTVPGALALLWWYPLQQLGGRAGWGRAAWMRAVRLLAPFGMLSVIFAAMVLRGLSEVTQLPLGGKLAVSAYSWRFYLAKTLWPSGLSPLYELPERVDPLATPYLLSYGILVAAALGAWLLRRRLPGAVVALLAFTVIVFPLLGLHQGGPQITADRNSYNASFPLALLAGGAVLVAWPRVRQGTLALAALVLLALGIVTWRQTMVWHDSERLWTRVLDVQPDSPHGHNNLGNVLMAQGRVEEALARYTRAVELRPTFAPALGNLALTLATVGRDDEALEMYRRAAAVDKRNADLHVNWGNALVRTERLDEALAQYATAVAIAPAHAQAHLNWGVALARRGAFADAAARFRRALEIDPTLEDARRYLAQIEPTTSVTR
jgi:protein O-mannosyl-transferase